MAGGYGNPVIASLRHTLAAAVQKSSTQASLAKPGVDPSVGTVYASNPPGWPTHRPLPCAGGAVQPPPEGCLGGCGGPPLGSRTPPMAPGPAPPAEGRAAAGPQGPGGADLERERELHRLRRELRKADEKANWFRSQVIALQQQVSSMGAPVMGASTAAAMPEELERLRAEVARHRTELADERAEKESLRSQLWEAQDRAGAAERELVGARKELASARSWEQEGRMADLDRELAAVRAELASARAAAGAAARAHQPQVNGGARTPPPPATRVGAPVVSSSLYPQRAAGDAGSPLRQRGDGSPLEARGVGHPGAGFSPEVPRPPRTGWAGDPLDPCASPGGPRRALVVGCDYPGKIGALRAGVADAQQWARFFIKRCGLPEHDIRMLSDDPSQYQQQARPDCFLSTQDNVLRGLRWLTAQSAPGDQLFFVFCGHGVQLLSADGGGAATSPGAPARRPCECALLPTDAVDGGERPRVVADSDVHRALLALPHGVHATLVYDSCHSGSPLDRSGWDFLKDYVSRGRVDHDKLRGHPVLPRFLELPQWQPRLPQADGGRESRLRCQAALWSACANDQFCVELPVDERPRGVFTYILISALLKAGPRAPGRQLLREAQDLTAQLKARWRLQQDPQFVHSQSSSDAQPFLS